MCEVLNNLEQNQKNQLEAPRPKGWNMYIYIYIYIYMYEKGKMVNHSTLSTGITLYKSKAVITSIGATNYPCEALIHRQTFKVDNQKKRKKKYKKKKRAIRRKACSHFPGTSHCTER